MPCGPYLELHWPQTTRKTAFNRNEEYPNQHLPDHLGLRHNAGLSIDP